MARADRRLLDRKLTAPALCRIGAAAMFALGMVLTYVDAQVSAERHIALSMPVPQPVEMERTEPTGGSVEEAIVLARLPMQDPLRVEVRDGFGRKDFLVLPLSPTTGDTASGAAGYAVLPAAASQVVAEIPRDGDGVASLHGLVGVDDPLATAARMALAEAGMPVAGDALALRLFTAPRDVVLAREIRNDWRPVAFWAAAVLLALAFVLHQRQLRSEAARARAARAERPPVAPRRPPATEKARTRFVPLNDPPVEPRRHSDSADLRDGLRAKLRVMRGG